jgi:hypothetical protein
LNKKEQKEKGQFYDKNLHIRTDEKNWQQIILPIPGGIAIRVWLKVKLKFRKSLISKSFENKQSDKMDILTKGGTGLMLCCHSLL